MGYNNKRFVKIVLDKDMLRKLAIAKRVLGLQGETPEEQLRSLIDWELSKAQQFDRDQQDSLDRGAAVLAAMTSSWETSQG